MEPFKLKLGLNNHKYFSFVTTLPCSFDSIGNSFYNFQKKQMERKNLLISILHYSAEVVVRNLKELLSSTKLTRFYMPIYAKQSN